MTQKKLSAIRHYYFSTVDLFHVTPAFARSPFQKFTGPFQKRNAGSDAGSHE